MKMSLITSCYNSELFLDGLIENTLKLSNTNFEHIIVDSNSTDNSIEVIKKWMDKDPRLRLIKQEKRTPYGVSWIEGWKAARGTLVCNVNTDDFFFFSMGNKSVFNRV